MNNKKEHYLIFINPAAGSGRAGIFYKLSFSRIFQKENLDFYAVKTHAKGDVENYIKRYKQFIKKNFTRIIAMGGDGTTWEVISSMVKYGINEIPLVIFPFGSGNDLARSLDMPLYNPKEALKIALKGKVEYLDVCSINDEYFANYMSFGVEGDVVTRRELEDIQLPGYISYIKPLINTLDNIKYYLYHLKMAEKELDIIGFTLIITNIPSMYGGMHLVEDAKYNDGLFEITIVKKFPSLTTIARLPFMHGKALSKGEFIRYRTDEVKIYFDDEVPGLQLDGEAFITDKKVFEIKMHKHAVKILTKKNGGSL